MQSSVLRSAVGAVIFCAASVSAAERSFFVEKWIGSDKIFVSVEISNESRLDLKGLSIKINGDEVLVPRSVYADLTNAISATVDPVGKSYFALTLKGGDGADAYKATILFKKSGVSKRVLFDLLDVRRPTQKTKYWKRVLRDVP